MLPSCSPTSGRLSFTLTGALRRGSTALQCTRCGIVCKACESCRESIMLTDRYDLPLSTGFTAARDAYVQGLDLALTLYPGAVEAFDRAPAADPSFALAHAGKAQVLMREGKAAAARAALAEARGLAAG